MEGESSGKLSRELDIDKSLICHWARAYRDKGEFGLEAKRYLRNSLISYEKRKHLSIEEQLRYAQRGMPWTKTKTIVIFQVTKTCCKITL